MKGRISILQGIIRIITFQKKRKEIVHMQNKSTHTNKFQNRHVCKHLDLKKY